MSSDNQITLTWVNNQIVNGNFRKIIFETGPLLSAVNGDIQSEFSTSKEEFGINEVFPNNENMAFDFSCNDRGKGFTHITRFVNVRGHITIPVIIKAHISGSPVEMAWLNGGTPIAGRQARNVFSDVIPDSSLIFSIL